jgi:enoyl-CoA hydratase
MPLVDFYIHNSIALLTVNRPEVRNALNWQAIDEFAAAIEQAHHAPDLLALIITGAGKAFISGGDIAELSDYKTEADGLRLITLMGTALKRLSELPCLTIAAIEGPARGGGAEVALACDWRVAAEDSDLGFVQIRLGLTTGWGGAARLVTLIGYPRALDLLCFGRVLMATEAQHLGLITHLTPPDEALKSAFNLTEGLAQFDLAALRAYKRLAQASERSMEEGQRVEREVFPKLWANEFHLNAVEKFLGK